MFIHTLTRKPKLLISAALLLSLPVTGFGASGNTQSDARDCSSIQDVEVPYDITQNDETLIFSGSSNITVSRDSVEVDGSRFKNPELAGELYARLETFLQSAGDIAVSGADFGMQFDNAAQENPELDSENSAIFLTALTNACEAILALEQTQQHIRAAYPDYIDAVKIDLGKP